MNISNYILNLVPWFLGFFLAFSFLVSWQRERREERRMRLEAAAIKAHREENEERRRTEEREETKYQRYVEKKEREEAEIRAKAGGGTGGYIVVDLPDAQRRLFHDLLKGFEEYARLKGYGVSFSVDSSFHDQIAFKFTLTDPDVVVGNERVRRDLKEYLDKVSKGEPLDDIPQIISLEEHEVLVATLKNRISFLQHSYNLAKTSVEFYEGLISRAGAQPFLPAQSVVVQTGGTYTAPNFTALNSPHALLGYGNKAENSIRIGVTYRERTEQLRLLAELLSKLQMEPQDDHRDNAIRNLSNVKEELEEVDSPEPGRVARWLQSAKEALQLGGLGFQTVQAAKVLFACFGIC